MVMLWIVLLGGCDDALYGSDYPATEANIEVKTFDPTWDGVVEFSATYCDGCHPAVYDKLDLPEDLALELQNPSSNYYVVPGDPKNSVLWQVISGTSPDQKIMPLGNQEPLDIRSTQHVRQWILDGAVVPRPPDTGDTGE